MMGKIHAARRKKMKRRLWMADLTSITELIPEYRIPAEDYLLADSLEELRKLNDQVPPSAPLLRVGLRIIPDAYDRADLSGIRVSEIPDLAPAIRNLKAVTVRGCFVRGDLSGLHGKALGQFFRSCYESAKIMSAAIPCAIPYLCVEGGLGALSFNQSAYPETLQEAVTAAQIVAMQNQTAFYAKLLIT